MKLYTNILQHRQLPNFRNPWYSKAIKANRSAEVSLYQLWTSKLQSVEYSDSRCGRFHPGMSRRHQLDEYRWEMVWTWRMRDKFLLAILIVAINLKSVTWMTKLSSFLVQPPFYLTDVSCRGLFSCDHTQLHTATVGRTPLDEGSARRRDLYLTTHTTLTTNIHAPGWIRTRNLSRRSATDLRLRPLGHWNRLMTELPK
jgi:hypothetical protein